MTAERILQIISENYNYFRSKMLKANSEDEYNMYNCALQGVYCIMMDIDKEGGYNGKTLLGLQKTE